EIPPVQAVMSERPLHHQLGGIFRHRLTEYADQFLLEGAGCHGGEPSSSKTGVKGGAGRAAFGLNSTGGGAARERFQSSCSMSPRLRLRRLRLRREDQDHPLDRRHGLSQRRTVNSSARFIALAVPGTQL